MSDVVLSSGFLAFARHVGFLSALEAAELRPAAICGTSSGALVGALWAAGHSARQIGEVLSAQAPLASLRLRAAPWSGLFSLEPLVERLRQLLPGTIEALPLPFAAGVVDPRGQYQLLTHGPLPEAVAASCAMPHVFAPVRIDGTPYQDGGAADRLGIGAWRVWRGPRPGVVHWVERTAGREIIEDLSELQVVRTPKSGARLWSLGDFWAQAEEARLRTQAVLAGPR